MNCTSNYMSDLEYTTKYGCKLKKRKNWIFNIRSHFIVFDMFGLLLCSLAKLNLFLFHYAPAQSLNLLSHPMNATPFCVAYQINSRFLYVSIFLGIISICNQKAVINLLNGYEHLQFLQVLEYQHTMVSLLKACGKLPFTQYFQKLYV